MAKALIKLAYRHIIDASSVIDIERKIFDDSYAEFMLKIQAYNPENKFTKFSEVVAKDGRANSLHYKCSFSVLHHIDGFQKKIPGLYDMAGRMNIPFEFPEFKILQSDVTDKNLHKVAVIYITGTFTLLESFGEYLVLASGDQSQSAGNGEADTFTLSMQPDLSVISYKEVVTEKQAIFSEP